MSETPEFSDLTSNMAEILTLMFFGEELEIPNPTVAAAEVCGVSVSKIAAVQRHLVRRDYLTRSEDGYQVTPKARSWWALQPESHQQPS
jgi:DNA-binding MarR family transcriptional regulator